MSLNMKKKFSVNNKINYKSNKLKIKLIIYKNILCNELQLVLIMVEIVNN
jgi:hypothetical protein